MSYVKYEAKVSGKNGGKACKNMHRLYLLRSGEPLPILLSLPPTSLKPLKNYIGKKVVTRGKRSWQVLTRITLKKETNAGGVEYSQAVFTKVGDLTPAECEKVAPMVSTIKGLTRIIGVTGPDMGADEGFSPVGQDEELPFE